MDRTALQKNDQITSSTKEKPRRKLSISVCKTRDVVKKVFIQGYVSVWVFTSVF
jgi:hypothetical protein